MKRKTVESEEANMFVIGECSSTGPSAKFRRGIDSDKKMDL